MRFEPFIGYMSIESRKNRKKNAIDAARLKRLKEYAAGFQQDIQAYLVVTIDDCGEIHGATNWLSENRYLRGYASCMSLATANKKVNQRNGDFILKITRKYPGIKLTRESSAGFYIQLTNGAQ